MEGSNLESWISRRQKVYIHEACGPLWERLEKELVLIFNKLVKKSDLLIVLCVSSLGFRNWNLSNFNMISTTSIQNTSLASRFLIPTANCTLKSNAKRTTIFTSANFAILWVVSKYLFWLLRLLIGKNQMIHLQLQWLVECIPAKPQEVI